MCIFANEGGPKSKSSRKETLLKIKEYKEMYVSGKNLEKTNFSGMSAQTPTAGASYNIDWLIYIYLFSGIMRGRQLDYMTAKERTLKTFGFMDVSESVEYGFAFSTRFWSLWVLFQDLTSASLICPGENTDLQDWKWR